MQNKNKPCALQPNIIRFRNVVIFGASGAIGSALCQQAVINGCEKLFRFYRNKAKLTSKLDLIASSHKREVKISDIKFDFMDNTEISNLLTQIEEPIDLMIIATGWLHNSETHPEKTIAQFNSKQAYQSWLINFLGPSQILKGIYQHQRKYKNELLIAVLSARLGSIADNHSGGWHSYRTSKASLNMMIKNFAIETAQKGLPWTTLAIQPGTTQSPLSEPFTKNLKPGQLQTPGFTAHTLWKMFSELDYQEHNGQLIDFASNIIEP